MNHVHDIQHHSPNQKTLSAYIVGFVLSVLLTLSAFALVKWHLLPQQGLYISLSLLAIMQLVVQAVCFLRLNAHSEGRENLFPFLFTILIICILVSGSLWIMYNLNYNMMMG